MSAGNIGAICSFLNMTSEVMSLRGFLLIRFKKMINFLFWNVHNKPLLSSIVKLAFRHEIDVLLLIENTIHSAQLLIELNQKEARYHYAPDKISDENEKIHIFTKFSSNFIRPIFKSERLTIRRLKLPLYKEILLAVTHFPSKLHWSNESQAFECVELANSIKMAESQVGHSKTVLVGDLNMNPFEDGVVSANGLHAVMTRQLAAKKKRVVQSKEYPFFYNPMWSLFGDGSPGPAGTYYYAKAEHKAYFWNMFDQVLIRPELLDSFKNEDLKIIDSDGDLSFLSADGLPNKKIASDHLPIFFRLNLDEGR